MAGKRSTTQIANAAALSAIRGQLTCIHDDGRLSIQLLICSCFFNLPQVKRGGYAKGTVRPIDLWQAHLSVTRSSFELANLNCTIVSCICAVASYKVCMSVDHCIDATSFRHVSVWRAQLSQPLEHLVVGARVFSSARRLLISMN